MPKTYSSDLFDLIHSLSKSEKRFFKLYSSKGNSTENKQYIKLFDVIDKQKVYDEEKTIKKVPEIKKFSVVKNQLYNMVLKSISILHQEKRLSLSIRSKLDYIEILYHKGLFNQCEKLLAKAKKQAQQAELFEVLLSIQKIEIKLLMGVRNFKSISAYQSKLEGLQNERAEISNKIQNIQNYFELYFPLTTLFYEGSRFSVQEKDTLLKRTMGNPLLTDESKALSALAKATFHITWSIYYFLKNETERAYAHAKKRLDILQEHPFLIEDSFTDYLNNIKYVSRLATEEREYIEALTWIGMIQSEIEKYKMIVDIGIRDHFNFQIHIAKLELFYSEKQFQDIIRYHTDIKEDLQNYEHKKESMIMNIHFYVAQAFFFEGKYHEALKYVNQILNSKFSGIHSDKHRIIQLLNILVHYELKNYDLLEYISKSYLRANKKQSFRDNIDISIINFINQKANSQIQLSEKSMDIIRNHYNKEVSEDYFSSLFDLNLWLKRFLNELVIS